MRIAICDDDERELEHLKNLVGEYELNRGGSIDCRTFHNSTEFLCNMKDGEYDLVFLDVLMPGVNGVQAAQELRERDKNVKLIFISSSSEYAVESYRVGAYYYLMKPADAASLFPLLDRVGSELFMQKEEGLVLRNREGVFHIAFARLEYVEVINKTVFFHMADGAVREMAAALAEFEEKLLARPEFLKIHRSYLVNLSRVQAVDSNCVVTKNGASIPISRSRRNGVKDAYMRFLHQAGTMASPFAVQTAVLPEKQKHTDGLWRILLVDDDSSACTYWADILRSRGCVVHLAGNGREALKRASEESYDCVLLDVMLPDEDGFSVCERLRELTEVPIIFLSCLTEADKQMEGFAAGGIDYITKDTPAELFWTKVETRIRLASSERTQLCYGPLLMDLKERRALMDGRELLLTSVEFDILRKLSENTGRIFTPEEIFAMIWGGRPWDGGQMVQTHMSRLRRKLEKAWTEHRFIETVWGQGYRFVLTED